MEAWTGIRAMVTPPFSPPSELVVKMAAPSLAATERIHCDHDGRWRAHVQAVTGGMEGTGVRGQACGASWAEQSAVHSRQRHDCTQNSTIIPPPVCLMM